MVAGLDASTRTGETMLVAELTGDEHPDLVLGEYEWEGRGRLTLFPGPVTGWSTVAPIFVEGMVDPTLGAVFGGVVASGDLNADGQADLVTGCHTCEGRRGVAYVFFGPLTEPMTAADASLTIRGESDLAWMGFGHAVLDHDGDGFADLVVAAASDFYLGPPRAGLLYVFRGPLGSGTLDPSTADRVYRGIDPYDLLGQAMAGCDLDGDGDQELVIGAPGDADGMLYAGRAFVVEGGPM
jgi:hypothetical protein